MPDDTPSHIGDEIERKFLVARVPDDLGVGVPLRQGYLAEDGPITVRLRLRPDRAELTVKVGSGLVRTEIEMPIDSESAALLWPHTEGRRLEKHRHRITLASGEVAEVDRYAGRLEGLVTVEVEFADRASAAAFVPPSWFGPEVTGTPGWSNAELARAPAPPSPS